MRRKDRLADLFGIDLRSLALFRVAISIVLLWDLGTRAFDLSSMYADSGAVPIDAVKGYYSASWHWSLHLLSGSVYFQALLFGLAAVFAVALLVGFHTRVATVASWLLLISLHSRVPLLVTGGDQLVAMMLFWGMFLPLGARWSIDARGGPAATDGARVLSVASAAILLQVAFMYVCTGIEKWNDLWLSGEALRVVLSDDMIVRPVGQLLLGGGPLLNVLTYATLALELVGPLLLFSPWQTRWFRSLALIGFFLLHLAIELSMTVLIFSYASWAALILFVPAGWWDSRVGQVIASWLDACYASAERESSGKVRKRATATDDSLRPSRLNQIVCGFFLLFVPLYNIAAQIYQENPSSTLRAVGHLAELTRTEQRWTMFAESAPRRYVGRGTLRDASVVDILRDKAIEQPEKPPATAAQLPSQRWMLLLRQLEPLQHSWFRRHVAEFLAQQWNDRNADERQLLRFDLLLYRLDVRDPADAVTTFAHIDLLAEGPYLNGLKHGRWVERHPNGKLAGEGEYRHGLHHGDWVFWSAAGDKESAGRFYKGEMHGVWTFWYEDGSRTAAFEHGERIE